MTPHPSTLRNTLWATGIWALAWLAMALLDGQVDLASLAMLVVLAAALASLWLAPWASAATGALAVLAFNVAFVPPRGTLHVDLRQHALLLGVLLVVNLIVAGLVSRLRHAAQEASAQAERAETLRAWGERLRDAADPQAQLGGLCDVLSATAGVPAAAIAAASVAASVALPGSTNAAPGEGDAWLQAGETDPDQVAGLKLCRSNAQAMGPGTGRYEDQPDLYLPLRGRQACLGAAVLRGFGAEHPSRFNEGGPAGPRRQLQAQLQALCDQMGLALQRARADRDELAARELAQQQGVRNSLLAAISHDYRTPLATVLGAASALDEQADRLDLVQRRRLAQRIVEETERLSRLTDNTLQLARLDGPGVTLRCDWESAEEVVGAALRHARGHDPHRRVRARLEPDLPLLWCDAMLMSQLLDNLVDNALKYSPDDAPVEILARQAGAQILLAVRDRGPGIAPAWRERVFEVFHRGAPPQEAPLAREADRIDGRPGVGVGLAVCRAIARAHGGELRLRARGHGGCAFECLLPLREPPAHPPEAGAAEFNPPEGASS